MGQVIQSNGLYPIVEVGSIETVQDIFGLYARLSGPLKEMEQVCDRQETLKKELKEAKETVSIAFIKPFLSALAWTFALAIPFIVLFLIVTNVSHVPDGRSLFDAYDDWLSGTALGKIFGNHPPRRILGIYMYGAFAGCLVWDIPLRDLSAACYVCSFRDCYRFFRDFCKARN